MLVLLFVLAETWIFVALVLRHTSVYAWGFSLALYVVAYMWLDDGPAMGHRSWNVLRSLAIWKRLLPITIYFSNQDLEKKLNQTGLLFIVVGSSTPLPLLYGFGLLPPHVACSVAVHRALFWIPLLRDLLLCMGCVAEHGDVAKQMLLQRRSVALQYGDESIFERAREMNAQIVPVYVTGERQRYWIVPGVPPVWAWLVMPRIFGRKQPHPMQLSIGIPMKADVFDSAADLHAHFNNQVESMKNVLV